MSAMIRTQIQLTDEQARALREVAARESLSIAEVVRRGVETVLRERHVASEEEIRRRAVAAAGRFHSGGHDLAVEHDRELAEAFAGR